MLDPALATLARPLPLPSGLVVPNRLAKAAMSEDLGDAAGGPSDRLVRLYPDLGRWSTALFAAVSSSRHVIGNAFRPPRADQLAIPPEVPA